MRARDAYETAKRRSQESGADYVALWPDNESLYLIDQGGVLLLADGAAMVGNDLARVVPDNEEAEWVIAENNTLVGSFANLMAAKTDDEIEAALDHSERLSEEAQERKQARDRDKQN